MKGKGQPQKQKITIDDINEMHLAVLQKENVKLDLEIGNLLLKKKTGNNAKDPGAGGKKEQLSGPKCLLMLIKTIVNSWNMLGV